MWNAIKELVPMQRAYSKVISNFIEIYIVRSSYLSAKFGQYLPRLIFRLATVASIVMSPIESEAILNSILFSI